MIKIVPKETERSSSSSKKFIISQGIKIKNKLLRILFHSAEHRVQPERKPRDLL